MQAFTVRNADSELFERMLPFLVGFVVWIALVVRVGLIFSYQGLYPSLINYHSPS